jgi:hypothetical protein
MTLRLVAEARECGTTIRLVGRMRSEDIDQVRAEIAASAALTALDLDELALADVDVIRFLVTAEREGIVLRHCPPFVREWMTREAQRLEEEAKPD